MVQPQREQGQRPRRLFAVNGDSAEPLLRVDGPLTVKALSRIRQSIVGWAAAWHLDELVVETVQTISSELAANIIVHARGEGRLVLTCRPGMLYCQAIDRGPGMPRPFLAGWHVPDIGDPAAARGLWTVRMLSARMQIDSSVMGTTVTAVLLWR
jgi:anti-sigma regulatory factor (Ser/Thr protein kinase)